MQYVCMTYIVGSLFVSYLDLAGYYEPMQILATVNNKYEVLIDA